MMTTLIAQPPPGRSDNGAESASALSSGSGVGGRGPGGADFLATMTGAPLLAEVAEKSIRPSPATTAARPQPANRQEGPEEAAGLDPSFAMIAPMIPVSVDAGVSAPTADADGDEVRIEVESSPAVIARLRFEKNFEAAEPDTPAIAALPGAGQNTAAAEGENKAAAKPDLSAFSGISSPQETSPGAPSEAGETHQAPPSSADGKKPDDVRPLKAELTADNAIRPALADRALPVANAPIDAPEAPRAPVRAAPAAHLNATLNAHPVTFSVVARTEENVLEIRLDPPELGKISIEFSELGRHGVRAIVAAETPGTLDLLRRNADGLIAELARHGFSGADLRFSDQPSKEGGLADRRRNAGKAIHFSTPSNSPSIENPLATFISAAYDKTV